VISVRPESALRPAQERTVAELMASVGVQAVLGMGAGKTAAALTAIRRLLDVGTIKAAIVIAPKRVAETTWPAEVHLWEHLRNLDLVVLSGSPKKRAARLAEQHDVYVCSIDNLQWLLLELVKRPQEHPLWHLLVIDELSRFKSPRGHRGKALLKVVRNFGAVWGLTGTPRPNSEENQWMPLQLVSARSAFPPFDKWRPANFRPLDPHGYRWQIHEFYRPIFKRVVADWSFTIPPHEVTDVPFNAGDAFDHFVDLSEDARQNLHTLDRELFAELAAARLGSADPAKLAALAATNPDNPLVVALTKAVATGKMSQVLQGFLYRDGVTVATYDNPKFDCMAELAEELEGEPILVAYNFRQELSDLQRLFGRDMPYLGAGARETDAARYIEQWNAGALPVMALHPASAGHGLNLQFGGRRIVWYSMTWSQELYAQTVKRLARPGQKLPVYSHRIRARHWLEDVRIARVEAKLVDQNHFIGELPTV